ncbi:MULTISPECIES: proteasome-activating nucleotidase Pan2 [Haloferax]|uniref:Proteasome-activating nucleotidase n=1 Tax=Haloferax marinum TaxID=2666143 RepID=A0A6A8G7S9_9EURY|nr:MULTISPECIES: proteasome-activating nucleotidase Pan2 [Haloferax]KAB1198064.1 proteasome-activating nucleotidase [Haloferax sp. CBA1150]MRW97134.1 proteasome-activating nucleotidase [Haloferax marinum]
MSRSPSLPERPHLDLDPDMSDAERLSALRQHVERMIEVNRELDERLESADEQHAELVEEVEQMKARNEALKTASYYIATVEELTDDGVIIKQHGNNQEVLTDFAPGLDYEAIEPGDRVAINDSFAVQTLLDDETDARAQAMEVVESPTVTYDDIGGIDEQVREVREAVEQPLENPEMFERVGIDPPSGVLLYGPPGTGKTMLAKAVANETNASFIKMAGSELVQKFIGEGARLVRDLFKLAAEREPVVIFIDEIDAVASKRTDSKTSGDAEVQRTMMQLLSEMDGFDDRGEIRIIAATNRFDMLDEAILRPGRFDRLIEVPKPAVEGRRRILDIHTRDMNVSDDLDLDELAAKLDDYSGADIASLTTEAGMFAIRDERTEVTHDDFEAAFEKLENVDESGTGPISGFTDYQY